MSDYLRAHGLLLGPEGLPNFRRIAAQDYQQAFMAAESAVKNALTQIIDNPDVPTYDNTIAPFLKVLDQAENISKLAGAHHRAQTTAELAETDKTLSAGYSRIRTEAMQNGDFYTRFAAVQEMASTLSPERQRILEKLRDDFVGLGMINEDGQPTSSQVKTRIQEIDARLFEQAAAFNKTLNDSRLASAVYLGDASQLEGVGDQAKMAFAKQARERGYAQGYLIYPDRLLVDTLLATCRDRDLRERLFNAVNGMGQTPPHQTTGIIQEMAELRAERAQLLGFETYADYVLRNRMVTNVNDLIAFQERMAAHLLPHYRKEVEIVTAYAQQNGHTGPLQPWDIDYWTSQYKQENFGLNAAALEPYLHADKTVPAMLDYLGQQYGLRFTRGDDIPTPHDDVMAFRAYDSVTGELRSIVILDLYAREGQKQGITRMNDFRYAEDGLTPIMGLQMNLPKGAPGSPTIIDLGNTQTLFHEMGHVIHGILGQKPSANTVRAINVGDLLEMPSQVIENVTRDPAFMSQFLRHHATGAPCPPELLQNLNDYMYFGFAQSRLRLIQNSQYDLALHSTPDRRAGTPAEMMAREELDPVLTPLIRPYPPERFEHLWFQPTAYAVGYYSYLWTDVLNAQASHILQMDRAGGQARLIELMEAGNAERADKLFERLFGPVDETYFLKRLGIDPSQPSQQPEYHLQH